MIVMGIDPGLANTGWAIVQTRGGDCRARAYGCISTSSSRPLADRLATIHAGIAQAIATYEPTELGIEKIFFGRNERSAILTAQARGAALVAAAEADLVVGEYTPMQIKEAVVGTGAADKHQVTYMVRSVLCLDHDPKPDHAADALAAAICHANLRRTAELGRRGSAADAVRAAELAQADQARAEAREMTAAARQANEAKRRASA